MPHVPLSRTSAESSSFCRVWPIVQGLRWARCRAHCRGAARSYSPTHNATLISKPQTNDAYSDQASSRAIGGSSTARTFRQMLASRACTVRSSRRSRIRGGDCRCHITPSARFLLTKSGAALTQSRISAETRGGKTTL